MTIQLPTGAVTFLFTDIEGSTQRWDAHPDAMRAALERHDALLRQAIESHVGEVFKTVGDAFCAAFATTASIASRTCGTPSESRRSWSKGCRTSRGLCEPRATCLRVIGSGSSARWSKTMRTI